MCGKPEIVKSMNAIMGAMVTAVTKKAVGELCIPTASECASGLCESQHNIGLSMDRVDSWSGKPTIGPRGDVVVTDSGTAVCKADISDPCVPGKFPGDCAPSRGGFCDSVTRTCKRKNAELCDPDNHHCLSGECALGFQEVHFVFHDEPFTWGQAPKSFNANFTENVFDPDTLRIVSDAVILSEYAPDPDNSGLVSPVDFAGRSVTHWIPYGLSLPYVPVFTQQELLEASASIGWSSTGWPNVLPVLVSVSECKASVGRSVSAHEFQEMTTAAHSDCRSDLVTPAGDMMSRCHVPINGTCSHDDDCAALNPFGAWSSGRMGVCEQNVCKAKPSCSPEENCQSLDGQCQERCHAVCSDDGDCAGGFRCAPSVMTHDRQYVGEMTCVAMTTLII